MRNLFFALPCLFALAACGDSNATCLTGSAKCGDTCVDTASDQQNCGGCGIACNDHEACNAGACVEVACLPGSTACGEACVNLASDQANCGACGHVCAGGQVCSAGACATSCAAPATLCGGACIDLTADRLNCGECGNACPAYNTCLDSTCTLEMWQPLDDLPSYVLGFSSNVPAAESSFYMIINDKELWRIDDGHTLVQLADAPNGIEEFVSIAHLGGTLYVVASMSLYAYSIADNTWSTPIETLELASPGGRQMAADDNGFLYFVSYDTGTSTSKLTKVDTASFTETHYDLPTNLGQSEPRTVYDHASKRVYVADYEDLDRLLHAFDPATSTFSAPLATYTDEAGYNDGFCTDSRGHIYGTISDTSSHNMWMYTASSNTWTPLPQLPFGVSSAGSCVVAGGWLYFCGDNSTVQFARYPIGR